MKVRRWHLATTDATNKDHLERDLSLVHNFSRIRQRLLKIHKANCCKYFHHKYLYYHFPQGLVWYYFRSTITIVLSLSFIKGFDVGFSNEKYRFHAKYQVGTTKFRFQMFGKSVSRLGLDNLFRTYFLNQVCELINHKYNHIFS